MDTTLIIMAAGIGSRYGAGIKQLAKMGPNGEIIMDYSIRDAKEAGFNKVVFITVSYTHLDIENVVRYYSKDKTEIITISRMFISISLNYKVAHKLKDNIKLIAELVELFSKEGYFEVEGVYLIKSDSIYCKSLYRLYPVSYTHLTKNNIFWCKKNGLRKRKNQFY